MIVSLLDNGTTFSHTHTHTRMHMHTHTDLEFKQRQPEVEKNQVTMSIKMGQGLYGEVGVIEMDGMIVRCILK